MAALAEFVGLETSSFAGLPMPATIRLSAPMSDDELIAFSRRNRAYRIERNSNGELEIMSPLGGKGGRGESYIIREMDLWAEQQGGESFSSNTGFRLGDGSVRCADVAWVSQARWNSLSDAEQTTFPPLCPDFVIELVSASDSRASVEAKMEMWIANGAGLAWMIDPYAGDITVYRSGRAPGCLQRPERVEADAVVPGFVIRTARLWIV